MKKMPSKKTMARRLDDIVRPVSKLLAGEICQTCQTPKEETKSKTLDWSHYISRKWRITRWDIRNSVCQCQPCHSRYADGICGPIIKVINDFWGEVEVDGVKLDMTDYLEDLVSKNRTIKGTLWDQVPFRRTLEIKYRSLKGFLEEGGTPTAEQFNLMKKMGYPNCKELQSHWKWEETEDGRMVKV
tara:strand:+ start:833 stop:1390 length:558 start_codon:yes stop_codon:yes gene_type:complete